MQAAFLLALVGNALLVSGQFDPHWWPGRSGIVQLFEWKWNDIGDECERFLAPMGFGGVQISPPTENSIILDPFRPWWERYQPVSYYLNTRSGNEAEFAQMVRRCNAVGVRIYADVVFNQMAATTQHGGGGGSTADVTRLSYPAVPYNASDFNVNCQVDDKSNPIEQRNCRLYGLPDLNQKSEWVRDRIMHFLNKLIIYGVAGFRVDAAKHMWPGDLQAIYSSLSNLAQNHGFPQNARPFITQVVVDMSGDGISKHEYTALGTITEFRYSDTIGYIFSGQQRLSDLSTWGPAWGFPPSERTLVFVDNQVNQRGHGPGKGHVLTYKDGKNYIMATAFMLAHTYGIPRVMSSYNFNNGDHGPPSDLNGNIISPTITPDGLCANGWVCEHRMNPIANMIGFRNAVAGTEINYWVDNGRYQVAFCRGNQGFIVFNLEVADLDQIMQTCLPAGKYCDVITGKVNEGVCTGYTIEVDTNGLARIYVAAFGGYGVLAVHVGARIQ
ncbi:alpha-amylase A-like [Ochlerotatus camptorhynchus]|uniref:alpha-amylase A-like n=1 Tax=Ochlerotatus camptorhynchus TaxID=644619 RepID=UPI0031E43FA8